MHSCLFPAFAHDQEETSERFAPCEVSTTFTFAAGMSFRVVEHTEARGAVEDVGKVSRSLSGKYSPAMCPARSLRSDMICPRPHHESRSESRLQPWVVCPLAMLSLPSCTALLWRCPSCLCYFLSCFVRTPSCAPGCCLQNEQSVTCSPGVLAQKGERPALQSPGNCSNREGKVPPGDLSPDSGTPPLSPPGVAGGFLLLLVHALSLQLLTESQQSLSPVQPLPCMKSPLFKTLKVISLSYWDPAWSVKISGRRRHFLSPGTKCSSALCN